MYISGSIAYGVATNEAGETKVFAVSAGGTTINSNYALATNTTWRGLLVYLIDPKA